MKTLKHLGIVLGIAFLMIVFLWAAETLSEGIPDSYTLSHTLLEIAVMTGYIFVIYSGIYFFLRLVFYLSRKKKPLPQDNPNNPVNSMV